MGSTSSDEYYAYFGCNAARRSTNSGAETFYSANALSGTDAYLDIAGAAAWSDAGDDQTGGQAENSGRGPFLLTNTDHPGSAAFALVSDPQFACYLTGTAIATPTGDLPVEQLAIGGRVVTAAGPARAIKRIGRRCYAGRFLKANPDLLPIRLRAGCLGNGRPRRDLLVSPKHAMLLEGCLIAAEHLVNGASIQRAEPMSSIEYFDIELDAHDVILAEGAPSESFSADHRRGTVHDAREFDAVYPGAVLPGGSHAPRLEHGFALAAIRRRVAGPDRARAPAVALRGNVDGVGPGWVLGWAQNPERPEAPVALDILVDGVLAARTLADQFRLDLKRAGLGSGRHAFMVAIPGALAAASIEVRRCSDGAVLAFATALAEAA
jgi:hypothetical protein